MSQLPLSIDVFCEATSTARASPLRHKRRHGPGRTAGPPPRLHLVPRRQLSFPADAPASRLAPVPASYSATRPTYGQYSTLPRSLCRATPPAAHARHRMRRPQRALQPPTPNAHRPPNANAPAPLAHPRPRSPAARLASRLASRECAPRPSHPRLRPADQTAGPPGHPYAMQDVARPRIQTTAVSVGFCRAGRSPGRAAVQWPPLPPPAVREPGRDFVIALPPHAQARRSGRRATALRRDTLKHQSYPLASRPQTDCHRPRAGFRGKAASRSRRPHSEGWCVSLLHRYARGPWMDPPHAGIGALLLALRDRRASPSRLGLTGPEPRARGPSERAHRSVALT
ncbi:hypothetical protein AcV7_001384 [Taiwanofungus camphoratus]|nr:hypothetical protein AcV7_001384 [Antrodia cinnamomea]